MRVVADSLISYFHYLGFMTLYAAMVAQYLLFKPSLSPAQVRQIARLDGVYGAAALVVLTTGLIKVFALGTPVQFYLSNGFFHAKVTLFVLVGLLSIWPTLKFLAARKQAQASPPEDRIELPGKIVVLQRAQLAGLALIPLLAALMVRYPI